MITNESTQRMTIILGCGQFWDPPCVYLLKPLFLYYLHTKSGQKVGFQLTRQLIAVNVNMWWWSKVTFNLAFFIGDIAKTILYVALTRTWQLAVNSNLLALFPSCSTNLDPSPICDRYYARHYINRSGPCPHWVYGPGGAVLLSSTSLKCLFLFLICYLQRNHILVYSIPAQWISP